MKKSLFLFIVLLNGLISFGQSSFIPQKLSSAVNSEYSDINPVLDPTGKTIYFNRVNHPENTFGKDESMDIWFSQLQPDGSWSEAKRLPFPFNTARSNAIVSISADGKEFLIKGTFSKRKAKWLKRGLSTVTKLSDTEWSKPKRLKVPSYSKENKGAFSNSFMSTDGNTLLLTYTKKWNGETLDLYISRKSQKGKWSNPKKIKNINEFGSIEAPFLSSDNKFIYFAANRFKGEYFDIMRSSRIDDSYRKWTEPVVLSYTINYVAWDSYYKTNIKIRWV